MRLRLVFPAPALVLAMAGLAACGSTAETVAPKTTDKPATTRPSGPRQSDPVLILANRAGAVSVGAKTGEVVFRAPDGVASPDSSTIVQAQAIDSGTRVVASDARTGVARWSHDVAGTRRVRVVAPGGRFVALVDGSLTAPAAPRAATSIAIATATGTRTVRLPGNLDPEAFSVNGRYLYVLDFLPAMDPTRYSVRRIDLKTNRVEPVPDRDGGVGEPMPGYARTQLMSPDGTQLYTFYASVEPVHDGDETYHAWVHVLNLGEGWAHCVDLDEKIGVSGDTNPALAVSPDGSRLFVTDGTTGALVAVDTKSLRVVRIRFLPALGSIQPPSLLATDGSTLFTGSGYSGLATIDARTLRPKPEQILTDATIRALRIDRSREALYVLTAEQLLVLDAHGRVAHRWANPGDADSIDAAVTVPGSGAYQCAC
jgi:outer membrane protein assembly factor BamB